MNMSETEYNKQFAERLRAIMHERGVLQAQISHDLGIPKGTVSNWATGKRLPRTKHMGALCKYLNCSRADLLEVEKPCNLLSKNSENKKSSSGPSPEAIKIAEQIDKNESLRLLFSVAVGSTPEDIKLAMDILWRIKHVMQGM